MKRQILISSLILLFSAGFAAADTIHVPGAFPYIDIQMAINIAQNGDVIIIAPGTYIGTGYNITKNITITGSDPNNPYVVESTVIDFDGQDVLAFDLDSRGNILLSGLTIANSYRGWAPVPDGIDPGDDGAPMRDNIGISGIRINGSHRVAGCIIRNCGLFNGPGGNGVDGDPNGYPGDPCDPPVPVHHGGSGGRGGHAYGAGIYIDSGNPLILNTIIEDCAVAGGPGGSAGEGLDADGTGEDPNLPGGPGGNGGNGGNAMGAGVYCDSGTSPTFRNCIFRNNQLYAGGANDGAQGGDGIIEDVDPAFHGGTGGHGGVPGFARGAGVYCEGGVTATFTGCQFIGNRAYGGYGGDGGDSGQVHLAMPWLPGGHGGLVEHSYSHPGTPQGGRPPSDFSAKGAGVYIEHGSSATFTGCSFRDNVTRGPVSGLGGWPNNGNRSHPRKNFPIPTYGAGVYSDRAVTTFTDCTFEGNRTIQEPNQYPDDPYPYGPGEPNPDFQYAVVDHTGYGAGMCFLGGILGMGNFGYVELTDCYIADNTAPVGGGTFASALTDFHVLDCNFVNNTAFLGAGLFSIDNYSTVTGSTFTGNRAYDPNADLYGAGGGIYSFSSDIQIIDCNISQNMTNGFGAGLYMAGEVAIPPLTADPVLKNCLLSNNRAGFDGGGIYCDWRAEPDIINCTIADNEAKGDQPFGVGYGGGLYCSYESDVNIINSIVWGNAGPNTIGPQFAVNTGYDLVPRPSTLTVDYSDVEGGQPDVLNWGTDNIDEDPLFVDGYYLSQTEAGQIADSPSVDTGFGLATDWDLHNYTTRTDGTPDANTVDMGYHLPVISKARDFNADGYIDIFDLTILLSYWMEQNCQLMGWCGGTDLDLDMDVDFVDYAIFTVAYSPFEDTNAPEPDPSTWAIPPYEVSDFTISMTATTATDESTPITYYFECTQGTGDGGDDSPWQLNPTYIDIVTGDETEYRYTVKARDKYNNETLASIEASVWIDHSPPSPDPSTWFDPPHAISSSAIEMEATTATDPGGVEYEFVCVSGGGNDSGWQESEVYVDSGLAPNTQYRYKVRTRDDAGNTGDWSIEWSATTLP
ncbi:MAG: right-handed parallel beta-helix repeat-containing protein [Planctomycetota bacterium]|jgi:predicted outer membrane repeat protein